MRLFLAVLGVWLAAGSASGQAYLEITKLKLGLPPGPKSIIPDDDVNTGPAHICKPNTWTPVYVDLQILREITDPLDLVFETNDSDDLGTAISVPLPSLVNVPPKTIIQSVELPYTALVRLSGRELTASVRKRVPPGTNPTYGRSVSPPRRVSYIRYRDTATYVVLGLGSRLPGFELPSDKAAEANNINIQNGGYRNGRVELAVIDNVFQMPDRWYGYDAADLIVLGTGTANVQNFLTPLFTDPQHKPRLDALFEWVRRGGRLVVSAGANAQLLSSLPVLQELLPVEINKENPTTAVKNLILEWSVAGVNKRLGLLSAKADSTFPLVNFKAKPDRGYRQIVPPVELENPDAKPAVVQAPYGLGRVSLIGFDVDRSPFTEFEARPVMWDQILRECGSARASVGANKATINYNAYGLNTNSEDELAGDLRTHTDYFSGVPVISFGWVAVFIILYTLLIGPIEYFVLKKVFKRLELTWITFPIIVITVSAIAYLSAYALKGSDLKVNKIDLIDVDAATNRVYGRTWFTVFSPRIDSYRVGVEPQDGLIAKGNQPHGGSIVDWSGGSRGGRGSFFRRSYFYTPSLPGDAGEEARTAFGDGLSDVPIQVWSTKAFAADWSGVTDRQAVLVSSNLIHPPSDRDKTNLSVVGEFTVNLPFKELRDVYYLYAGKAYKKDQNNAPLVSGVPEQVVLQRDNLDPDWLTVLNRSTGGPQPTEKLNPNVRRPTTNVYTGTAPVFNLMFHEEAGRSADNLPLRNATLRRLDQSWRLSPLHQDELIIIGRVPTVSEVPAEQLFTDPASVSPTKLWLKDLPGKGKTRAPQQGTLQQETFVRIFVPIKPVRK